MGLISDAYRETTATADNADPTVGGEFSKGVSRGLRDTGASIEQGFGLLAELKDTARQPGVPSQSAALWRSRAKTLRESAGEAQFAPEAQTWDDAHGAGQTLRWVTGKAGEMIPMLGTAVAGSVITGNPLVGGTLAMTPAQIGEIDRRQQEDPNIAAQPVNERGLRAGLGGLAGAAVGNLPLGGLAGKFGAKAIPGLELAGTKTLAGGLVRNVGEGATTGALGMGGTEVANQLGTNPDAPMNWEQVGDAAKDGAIVMGAMHAPAAIPSALKGSGTTVGGGFKSIRERLAAKNTEAVAPAAESAAAPEIPSMMSDIKQTASDFLARGKSAVDTSVDDILGDRPLGASLKDMASATPEKIKEMFDISDKESYQKAKEWGEDMLSKLPTDDPRVQAVTEAMKNAGERSGQVAMAGLRKAYDLGQRAADSVSNFAARMKANYEQGKKADLDGEVTDVSARIGNEPKLLKSEDYSGARKVIAEELLPLVKRNRPELLESADSINALADAMRQAVAKIGDGTFDHGDLSSLTPILGSESIGALKNVYDRLHGMSDPEAKAAFFGNLNKVDEINDRATGIHDLVDRSFTDEARRTDAGADIPALVSGLIDHARGVKRTGEKPSAEDAFYNKQVADHMKTLFGDKADAVSQAIEKEAGLGGGRDETTGMPESKPEVGAEAAQTETLRFGLTEPDAKGNSNSKMDGAPMAEDSRYAKQHIADLKTKFPDHDVRWEKVDDPESNLGHLVVEKAANPEALSHADVEGMKLDTKRYAASKDRVEVGGQILDTRRIAGVMDKRLPYSDADGQGRAFRTARMFNEGAARLMEKHGKFEIPDSAVIGRVAGKDFTFGEARKLKSDTATAEHPRIAELRKEYKDASQQDRVAILQELDDLKNKELTTSKDDFEDTTDSTKPLKPSKDGQIHQSAKDVKEKDLIQRSNEDGSAHAPPSDRPAGGKALNALITTVGDWAEVKGAGVKPLIDRANKLIANAAMLGKADLRNLTELAGKSPAEAAATINGLAKKYAARIVAPGKKTEGPTDPKPVAAKKAAFLERAASGDAALVKELSTSTDAKGLQRAIGAMTDRLSELATLHSGLDRANYPATLHFLDGVKSLGRAGVKSRGWLKSPDFLAAMREVTARGMAGDKIAPLLRDQVLSNTGHIESLIGDAHTASALERVISTGKSLGEAVDTLNKSANLAPQFKVIADVVARVAGDVPLKSVKDLGGLDGRYFPETQEIHITSDAGRMTPWLVLHEGVHAATVKGLKENPELHAQLYELLGHAVRENKHLASTYGGMNTLEFLAEGMSNVWFQGQLGRIRPHAGVEKYLGATAANAWGEFTQLVRRALGLPEGAHSALTQLMDLGGRAMLDTHDAGPGHFQIDDLPARGLVPASDAIQSLERLHKLTKNPNVAALKQALVDSGDQFVKHDDALILRVIAQSEGLTKALRGVESMNDLQEGISKLQEGLGAHGLGASLDAANKRMSELVKNPDVAYGLQTKRYSMESAESTNPDTTHTSGSRPDVAQHIEKVLGQSVKLAWANITHAGEYVHSAGQGLIRLSVHALDPMSTAYHESLHAFFAQMRDAGAHDVTRVLEKAASQPHVIKQLQERFKNEPAVLKQLENAEERASYMYQMWALDPKGFKVSIAAQGVFGRIAAAIRKMMSVWSNDERALHIMDYFNSGEYGKSLGHPSAVRRALMEPGRNQAYEMFTRVAKPLAQVADASMGVGVSRLRGMDIPALGELADALKRDHLDASGKDQGFISASRVEATKRRTELGEKLNGYSDAHLRDAMEAMQSEKPAATPEGRLAAREIKTFLREAHTYMTDAGVQLGDLGENYFPRVWDTHYISKNLQAFRDMMEPYVRSGEYKGSVDELVSNLINRGGNEFGIEVREPGMQFAKERKLGFIAAADASAFLSKDLHGTLNSYLTQATRRAEWNRRLGNGKLEQLWADAKSQGATAEQLDVADRFMKGIDGTLGDTLNPQARRIMGNMIVYQNIRLLPLASFSMMIDPLGVMVRGGSVVDAVSTFKRGMKDLTKAWSKDGPANDHAADMAELVGVIDSAAMSHTMGDIYTQGMVGGAAEKINNTFFKYNLVESMNRSFRIGASEAAMKFMAKHADGKASLHSARWMKELNLKEGDVKLTPDGRIALTTNEGLTPEQVTRVHMAVNQWVDGAVLRPDAADKPIWMNDPHFALVSHLKQFVFSFQKTIIERVIHEVEHGNYTPAMALASYVPVMMAADMAKGVLTNGGDQPDSQKGWDAADYVGHGMQRAGLLGVGQFAYDIQKDIRYGNSGIFALAGPTIEQLRDGVEVLGGHKQFSGVAVNAMPANALYKHTLGEETDSGPMFSE